MSLLSRRFSLVFLLAAANLAGCASTSFTSDDAPPSDASGIPIVWSPRLELGSLADLPTRIARPFPVAVAMRRGGETLSAPDCPALLEAREDGASPADDHSFAIARDEGATCLALDELTKARPPRATHLEDFELSSATRAQLPPTFVTPFAKGDYDASAAAEAKGQSLANYDPGAKLQPQGSELVLHGQTWQTTLQVLARGDFDGSGLEEWLVAAHDTATEGTFDSTRLLLVTRTSDGGPLHTLKRLQ